MNKPFTALTAALASAVAVLPIAAPTALASTQASPIARAAVAYPVPPGPGPAVTPAAAAHAAAGALAGALAKLTPAALAGKGAPKLAATAPGSGTFTVVLTARIHGKTVIIAKGSQTAGAAGALTLKLKLTKAGKAALKGAKGKLKVTVAASFKSTQGAAATAKSTVTLK
jgi:hypothetical protein